MVARLIVTIDTEEEGLWSGEFRAHGNKVENIKGIPWFQELCDQFGVVPTYLIDTPVVEDDYSVGLLSEIAESGRCEIGTHLHPWCAPPHEEPLTTRNSFLCNLPPSLQREKLLRLTGRIAERFGREPRSFRAGRYGLDAVGARILRELGYLVDSSVIPFTEFLSEGGPDFRKAPHQPYRISPDHLLRSDPRGELLEVPVSVGFSRPDFAAAQKWREWGSRSPWKRLRAVGILDRLGISHRIKFSPEQADTVRTKQLVTNYQIQNSSSMVLMFHSTSLVPGYSPYVRDAAGLQRFRTVMAETFEFCVKHCGMRPASLTGFGQEWLMEQSREVALSSAPSTQSRSEGPLRREGDRR